MSLTTRLAILSYHNVEGTWAFPAAGGAGLRGFRQQLDWLGRHMHVVGLGDALAAIRRGDALPKRSVAITFDDGYRDNLDLAAAELRARAMPATFFLVPRLIDRTVRPWWEVAAWALTAATATRLEWEGREVRLDGRRERAEAAREIARSLKRVDRPERERLVSALVAELAPAGPEPDFGGLYVDADGARELAGLGFTIGSHSMWHAILSRETPQEQAADLAGSKRDLEALLDRPVTLLAYPNGTSADYSAHTIAAAGAAGYTNAVTTRIGLNGGQTPPFELRRFIVSPRRGTSAASWGGSLAARAVRVARRKARALR